MSRQLPADLLTKPSLSTLAFVLRHRELWPEGFEWDYTSCESCAIGMAVRLGFLLKIQADTSAPLDGMAMLAQAAQIFSISENAAHMIFFAAWRALEPDVRFSEVTPERVADVIDAHLAREG